MKKDMLEQRPTTPEQSMSRSTIFPGDDSFQALRHLRLSPRSHRAHGARTRPDRRRRRVRAPDGRTKGRGKAAQKKEVITVESCDERKTPCTPNSTAYEANCNPRALSWPTKGMTLVVAREDAVLRRDGRPGWRQRAKSKSTARKFAVTNTITDRPPAKSISTSSPSQSPRAMATASTLHVDEPRRAQDRSAPLRHAPHATGRCGKFSATPSRKKAPMSAPTACASTSPTARP